MYRQIATLIASWCIFEQTSEGGQSGATTPTEVLASNLLLHMALSTSKAAAAAMASEATAVVLGWLRAFFGPMPFALASIAAESVTAAVIIAITAKVAVSGTAATHLASSWRS